MEPEQVGYSVGWEVSVLWSLLLACVSDPKDTAAASDLTCTERFDGAAPTSEDDLRDIVAIAITNYAVPLEAVSLQYTTISSDSVFFQANLDVTTIEEEPLERTYTLQYNPALFDDPPSQIAVGAILVHELRHVLDYTEMTSEELGAFAAWYITEDVSAYERETDEYALEQGCGEGLTAYREWLYETIPPEDLAEKQRNYYTPDEIREWMAAH
jgi:hypothetical protein